MRGLVNKIFLIHLVIAQGDNSDKTWKFDQMLIKLKLKAQETLKCKRVSYRPQIDQMSIKIESSRNITNVSAIDPKVQLQMATSVCVSDFKLIQCRAFVCPTSN